MKEYFEITKHLMEFIEKLKEEYKLLPHEVFFLHCAETQFVYIIETLIQEKQQKASNNKDEASLNK